MKDAGKKRDRDDGAARLRWLIGLGIAALAPPLVVRCVAGHLRRKPDADAGEALREPLGEKGRYIDSFDGARIYTEELGAGQAIVFEPAFRFAIEHPGLCDGIKRAVIGTSLFLVAVRYLGHGSGASLTQMEFIGEVAGQSSIKGACQAGLALFGNESGIPLEPLRDSGIPVVIWVGEKDRLTRPDVSRRMGAELPGSELHVVPDTGHASFMEEYRGFNRVLSEFAERAFARKAGGD